jgi:type I restriction enzyme S subunit
MSRIDELIAELCPNGVEFKALGDIASLERGRSITKEQVTVGEIPVIAGGRTAAYMHGESNRDGQTIVIAGSGAYAGFVSWWEGPIYVSDAFSVKPNGSELLARYCYHWLISQQEVLHSMKKGGGVPHVYAKDAARLKIPVPPLEVQREIVRILDKFTQLEADLEAELEARRRQYQYYQQELLSFSNDEAKWMFIGDIGRVSMCKRIFKSETSEVGEIPFFKIGTFGKRPDAFISRKLFDEYRSKYSFPKTGDVLISAAGTIGRTVVYDGNPAYFQDSNIVWIDNDESVVLNAYLQYWYRVIEWSTDGGTIRRLYNENIRRARIAVPSQDAQGRIVAFLDKFDALVNDLSSGLPAELAARRKQYEYYRDRLLTFKEVSR